jgi:hypothetical protein
MPISYDRAFGGVDEFHENKKKHSAFMSNPVGKGFHLELRRSFVDGSPMPNTEELKRAVTMPDGNYKPMAFGPIGRSWSPRYQLAGTYGQHWLDTTFPAFPPDFNLAYYQAAPEDQQMPYPKGGERVFLDNLSPQGQVTFTLPEIELPVVFFYQNGETLKQKAMIDTITLEPDDGLFTLTWRATIPLKRTFFEISQVLVGRKSKGWWRARRSGKTFYPSLAHLAERKQKESMDKK